MAKHTYGELKDRLEEILAQIQENETDLDTVLVLHEEGKKIILQMEEYLKDVEQKLKNNGNKKS